MNMYLHNSSTQELRALINPQEFSDPIEYLHAVFGERKKKNSAFTLSAWSKRLGYSNPSLLSDVMRGRRKINGTMILRMCNYLGLRGVDRDHFELICKIKCAKTMEEKDELFSRLLQMHPGKKLYFFDLDEFHLIQDWYHLVILEMADLKDFREDPVYLAKRLKGGISPKIVEIALQRLERLKLLVRQDGKLTRSSKHIYVGKNVPDRSIRAHHEQFLDLAKESLKTDDIKDRHFSGSVFSCAKEDFDEVQRLIEELHQKLGPLSKRKKSDSVFRINVQLMQLTQEV